MQELGRGAALPPAGLLLLLELGLAVQPGPRRLRLQAVLLARARGGHRPAFLTDFSGSFFGLISFFLEIFLGYHSGLVQKLDTGVRQHDTRRGVDRDARGLGQQARLLGLDQEVRHA